MMNTTTPERTPLVIAAEINTINRQTGAILFQNALEIGQRLQEAKTLVKHGEWAQWLAESVRYSQRSANRLIQLYEEYGASPADNPNSPALSNITYTNALILLDVPPEQREDFIANHDVANMSSRALKQAVTAARSDTGAPCASDGTGQAPGTKTPVSDLSDSSAYKLDEALQKIDDLQCVLSAMVGTITALTHHVQNLEQRVQELTLKVLSGKSSAPKNRGIKGAKNRKPPTADGAIAPAAHDPDPAGAQAAGLPSSEPAPDSADSVATVAADSAASSSNRAEPGFKVSGLDNPDPDYYTREADNLYSLHVKAITDAFTQLQQLLKALALEDKTKKEALRQKLQKLMERLAASITVWPPVVRMR